MCVTAAACNQQWSVSHPKGHHVNDMEPLVDPKISLVHDIPKLFMIDGCRGSGKLSTIVMMVWGQFQVTIVLTLPPSETRRQEWMMMRVNGCLC